MDNEFRMGPADLASMKNKLPLLSVGGWDIWFMPTKSKFCRCSFAIWVCIGRYRNTQIREILIIFCFPLLHLSSQQCSGVEITFEESWLSVGMWWEIHRCDRILSSSLSRRIIPSFYPWQRTQCHKFLHRLFRVFNSLQRTCSSDDFY